MKTTKIEKLNIFKKRFLAISLAASMSFTSLYATGITVHADDKKDASTTESSSEEVDDAGMKVLKDNFGRITIYKWTEVKPNSASLSSAESMIFKAYTGGSPVHHFSNSSGLEGSSVPLLFVPVYPKSGKLVSGGALSLFYDKDHIYKGTNFQQVTTVNQSQFLTYQRDKELDSFIQSCNTVPNFKNYDTFAYAGMDQQRSVFFKSGEEGKVIPSSDFNKSVFYSPSSSTYGALWTEITSFMRHSDNGWGSVLMITKKELDGSLQPDDFVYAFDPANLDSKVRRSHPERNRDEIAYGISLYINGSGDERREPGFTMSRRAYYYNTFTWHPANNNYFFIYNRMNFDVKDEGTAEYIAGSIYDLFGGETTYAVDGSWAYNDGWVIPVGWKKGYDMYGNHHENKSEKDNFSDAFKCYVGMPTYYSCILGNEEGKDDGGKVFTIDTGDIYTMGGGKYTDVYGNEHESSGVILKEGYTIHIKEGGVLAVTGNLLNNGKIINEGGTIIVKEGGMISPFGQTKEGTIECKKMTSAGPAGDMIIMKGGRVYTIADNDKTSAKAPTLTLSGGATVINYGILRTTNLFADSTCKLEARRGSTICTNNVRTDKTAMFITVNDPGGNVVPAGMTVPATIKEVTYNQIGVRSSDGKKMTVVKDKGTSVNVDVNQNSVNVKSSQNIDVIETGY